MRIEAIAIGTNPPHDVNVIIEVPLGGQPIKYELDKDAGTLVVNRFLYTSMAFPGNYGFVPHTQSADGEPIDVLVCNTRPLLPGCVINVRPIGILVMEDNLGVDEKIIAVPSPHLTRRYDGVTNYSDVPTITLQQIEHFFEHYKDLEEGKWVKIGDWGDAAAARRAIGEAISSRRARRSRATPRDATTTRRGRRRRGSRALRLETHEQLAQQLREPLLVAFGQRALEQRAIEVAHGVLHGADRRMPARGELDEVAALVGRIAAAHDEPLRLELLQDLGHAAGAQHERLVQRARRHDVRRGLAAQHAQRDELGRGQLELREEPVQLLGVPQRRMVEPQHDLFGGGIAFGPILLEEVQQLFRRAARRHAVPACPAQSNVSPR